MRRQLENRHVGIGTAVLVIALGVFFLFNELGMFPHGIRFNFWAIVFIAVGLGQMISASRGHDRVWGVGLVLVGVVLQTNAMGLTHVAFWNLWPVVLIVAGVSLLWHAVSGEPVRWIYQLKSVPDEKTDPSTGGPGPQPAADGRLKLVFIFSGTDRQMYDKHFRGGKLVAIFGGFKLDLTRCDIEGNQAVLEVNAIFGGGELRVPETWRVVMEGAGILGGYEDQTRYFQPDPAAPVKTLIVRGAVIFGGISIKN